MTGVQTCALPISTKLKQMYYDIDKNKKISLLVYLLKHESSDLVMVFCNTRRNVDLVAKNLKRYEIDSLAIHGGLAQNKRSNIMKVFHSNSVSVLVCTDVAARGLDIKGVSHVYNYDIPKNSTEYIHRIGRTARAGKEGKAISIVSQKDYDNFRSVNTNDFLDIKKEILPKLEQLSVNFQTSDRRGRDFRGRDISRGRSSGKGYSGRREFKRPNSVGRNFGRTNDSRERNFKKPHFKGRDSGIRSSGRRDNSTRVKPYSRGRPDSRRNSGIRSSGKRNFSKRNRR